MTIPADFATADWELLVRAPALTALAMIYAERCSLRTAEHKLQAAFDAMPEPAPDAPGSALIAAVRDAVRTGQSPRWPSDYHCDLTDIGGWALESCRRVAALLAQRTPAVEAEAFSQWLYAIAQQVALVPEGSHPAAPIRTAPTGNQGTVLDLLAIALDLPSITDGMCALSQCWRPPLR